MAANIINPKYLLAGMLVFLNMDLYRSDQDRTYIVADLQPSLESINCSAPVE